MATRQNNGYIVLTEKGQQAAVDFIKAHGEDADQWDVGALYEEIESDLNNTSIGEQLAWELCSIDSVTRNPVHFNPSDDDIEYQPIED